MLRGSVRVRFAPSPTGFLHLGGLRTALFNYLYARRCGGRFILRIEDTDQMRTVPGAIEQISNTLRWANILPDEGPGTSDAYGPYIQSERRSIYQSIAERLLKEHAAYRCFCTSEQLQHRRSEAIKAGRSTAYDRHCAHLTERDIAERIRLGTPYTIRLRVPTGKTVVHDELYGQLTFQHTTQEDSILMKSDGMPTYHLANVVDDHTMNITHVMRGEEWLPSTPKHIMLYNMLNWTPPTFIHLPLLLNTDHTKLSKRSKHANVQYYQHQGYLPETVVNFVSLLGWSPKTTQELFTMDQLIEQFSIKGLNRSGAVVSHEKLDWLNKQYILKRCKEHDINPLIDQLQNAISHYANDTKHTTSMIDINDRTYLERVIYTSKERVNTINEIATLFPFFFTSPNLHSNEALAFLDELNGKDNIATMIPHLLSCFDNMDITWTASNIKTQLRSLATTSSIAYGKLLRVLRYMLTGTKIGPDIIETAATLGRKVVLERIRQIN
ncbi:glutamyl-tRNA synthetase [Syncephalis plumigaleata]|nr:glutamyl-tRNA synthetase [Syncephalis plumigaleata]